jgi:hypothetical protein
VTVTPEHPEKCPGLLFGFGLPEHLPLKETTVSTPRTRPRL